MNKGLSAVSAIILALIIALPWTAYGGTLYVGPGETYTTIQSAINASVNSDIIIVRDETYTGAGNKNLDFGGKAITVRSENGPTACTIDCEGSGRGFYFHSGETASSVVDGFSIINADAGSGHGGAISCDWPTSPTITNCIMSENSANWGGAIYCHGGTARISGCLFSANTSTGGRGGAIYCSNSDPNIVNCVFTDNTVPGGHGGAVLGWTSSPTITHSTFIGNSASGKGGAVCFWMSTSTPSTVTNSILWGDSAATGPEISVEYGASLAVSYSDIDIGSGTAYVDSSSSLTWGSLILNTDPSFLTGDYHLGADSPCIDQGTDAGVYTDIDGDTRPAATGYDIGADEAPAIADNDGDGCGADVDCDDTDSSVYPGAPELCDGKDNDCDGFVPADEVDADGDDYMICDGDCSDADAYVNPDAYELPGNAIDENCDGSLGACDPNAEWKNHGQYVRCVAHETDALIEAGILTQEEGDELISSAAQSDIGKK